MTILNTSSAWEAHRMGPLLAMAGPAEAAEFFALMIGYGGLLLIGLAAAIGLFARSRIAAGVALVLAFGVTLLFMPWEAFRSYPYQTDDPDIHYWVLAWQKFGLAWGVVVLAAIVATIRAFGFPTRPAAPASQQGTPNHPPLQTGGA